MSDRTENSRRGVNGVLQSHRCIACFSGTFSGNWLQSATGGLSLLCGSASRRNAVAVHSRGLSRPTTRRRITCRSRSLARPQPWKLRMCPLSNRAARPLAVTRSCLSALLARKPRWLRRSTRAGLGSLRRPLLSSDRAVKSPCFSPFLAHPFKIMRTPARDWTDHLEAQQCENIAMHKATSRPTWDSTRGIGLAGIRGLSRDGRHARPAFRRAPCCAHCRP